MNTEHIISSLLYRKEQLQQNFWCYGCDHGCWCKVSLEYNDSICDYCRVVEAIKEVELQIENLLNPEPEPEPTKEVKLSEKQKKTQKKQVKNIKAERQRKMVSNKV